MATTTLTLEIEYDPELTHPEGLALAMDRLLETALSTPGIMDEYGQLRVGEFFVATRADNVPQPPCTVVVEIVGGVLQEAYSSDPAIQLRLVDWDTEGCTPDEKNGIVEGIGENGHSWRALVTEFPTVSIEQMNDDTRQALRLACFEPQEVLEVQRGWVLCDLDGGRLLSTRVYNEYRDAAEDAAEVNDVLILPLVIRTCVL